MATAEASGQALGGIPVRNLWLLFLYAADLAAWRERFDALFEDDDADLPTLIARLLVHTVEHRLKRNLSRGYRLREEILGRVRGRIDLLESQTLGLLARGRVACRFEDLTFDTTRNRLVRAALDAIVSGVDSPDVARQCRLLSAILGRLGVAGRLPSRAELASDVIGRNELDDRLMVALAKLALELALPSEEAGRTPAYLPIRDAVAARRLFERAVGGFYRVELAAADGWQVARGTRLHWAVERPTPGLANLLPGMEADIVLSNRPAGRRIVIDTKFCDILATGRWGTAKFRSGYLFQLYAYLRSQAGRGDPLADAAEGLLLHPTIGIHIDESAEVQGHRIRFATVDLAASAVEIRRRLLELAA